MGTRLRAIALLSLLLAWTGPAHALEKRVALVIGNAAYPQSPLRNPVNDARAMAATLQQTGFQVIARENATKQQMERAVGEFSRALTPGSVALFYYAGHGMQVNGRNFLVPVDAQIASEQTVRLETLDVDVVLDQIAAAGSDVNLVVLDACRNNPFERRFRSTGGGLAQINAPKGTLIAYATAPGKVAADGDGRNGLYTSKLVEAIKTPGIPLEEVFKRVRIEVSRESKDEQTPWEASSLVGNFYFLGPTTVTINPPAAAPTALPRPAPQAASAFDGNWEVTLSCPRHTDGAKGYRHKFLAEVRNGLLHGAWQSQRTAASLVIGGAIQPDGTATLSATGTTGDEEYSANRVKTGTKYGYTIRARFDGAHGSGSRVEGRICNLVFARQ